MQYKCFIAQGPEEVRIAVSQAPRSFKCTALNDARIWRSIFFSLHGVVQQEDRLAAAICQVLECAPPPSDCHFNGYV